MQVKLHEANQRIAALEEELAAEVNARHALEDTMEQFAERVSRAEADKQIAVEALRSIKNLELDPTNPEAFARRLRQILAQALSRIEEKPGYDAGIEVGGTTHHRIEEP
jgi:predicted  nucleic acid-binding Zn-ribbon protein